MIGPSRRSEWFRRLIDSTPDLITVVSAGSGRMVDVNTAFMRATGFRGSEIIGKTPVEAGFLSDPIAYDHLLREPTAHRSDEFNVRTSSGETRCAQTTTMAIEVAGQPCLIVIWRDITERKQLENDMARARDLALESAQLKTQFLANVSHELRTPLNGIMGMSQLLLDTQLTSEQREFAGTIDQSSRNLLKVVNDVLDFSEASHHRLRFERVDFDLRPVVETALFLYAPAAARKGLEISSSIDPAVPGTVNGDTNRLSQVLTNLIGNAIKFTEAGKVSVLVAPETSSEDATTIRFEVSDSGIGISEADQARIFQPFVQVDGTTTRRYGGTGLGLAICAKLVELMNGEIGVRSASGRGSTFFFTARFLKADGSRSAYQDESVEPRCVAPRDGASRPGRDQIRVLIVEDSPVSQLVLRGQLKKLGYTLVESASNGAQALEMISKCHYDVVLMDCQMPVMDGRETTAKIRSIDRGVKPIAVIAVTASAFARDREKCLAAGMDDYIAKPLRLEELDSALERWCPRIAGR